MSELREALRKAERASPLAGGSGDGRGTPAVAADDLSLEPVEASACKEARDFPTATRGADTARPFTDAFSVPRVRPHSRAPFYVVLALLAASGSVAGGHFWIELRAASAAPRALPAMSAAQHRAEAPAPAAAPLRIAGLPEVGDAPAIAPPALSAPSAATAPVPRPQPAPRASLHPATEAAPPRLAALRIHPRIDDAQAALRVRQVDAARTAFAEVLGEEPLNRDALLGAAAVETLARRPARAEAHLARLLGAHPGDTDAQAALLALRETQLDAVAAERHVKELLRDDSQPAALHFLLGNQHARQGHWTEAHEAYLRARERDPEHPDFAFNLAVALDRLGRHGEARDEYARALAYAERRVAVFDRAAAQRRLQALAR